LLTYDWLLALVPLVVIASIWRSQQQRASPGRQRAPRSDNGRRPAPDFEALIETIREEGRANRALERREDRTKVFREWLTITLVAFTLLAIVWQVREMIRVYEPIKEQADATARILAVTERSSVYFGKVQLSHMPKPDGSLRETVLVEMGNSGGTTTRGLRFRLACRPSGHPLDNPFDRSILAKTVLYRVSLPPKLPPVTPEARDLTAMELAVANVAKLTLYILGEAYYEDTFDPGLTLELCMRLYDFSFAGMTLAAMNAWCEQHNCADQECTD
jgi:hypothetical protein